MEPVRFCDLAMKTTFTFPPAKWPEYAGMSFRKVGMRRAQEVKQRGKRLEIDVQTGTNVLVEASEYEEKRGGDSIGGAIENREEQVKGYW